MRRAVKYAVMFALPVLMGLSPAGLTAKNGNISFWTRNISEMYGGEIWGIIDYNPEIAVSGETVHALWMADNAGTTQDIFYRRSLDGGQTWEARKMIFSDAYDDVRSTSYLERLAVDGDTVHVLINGFGHGNDWFGKLSYIRSIDNGQNFEDPRVIYSTDDVWLAINSRIRARDGQVTILFQAQVNWYAGHAARLLISEDGGDTFRDEIVYSRDDGSTWHVIDFYWQDNIMYVLYHDAYWYYGLQYGNLYLAASTDGGQNFESRLISVPSVDEVHKTHPLYDENYVPKIAASGNTVYVVWSGEDENSDLSVFVRRSTDNGRNWDDAVNLTRDRLPEGLTIQSGQETIAAKNDYIYIIFNTSQGRLFFARSQDGGGHFEPIRQVTKSVGTQYVEGGWEPRVLTDPHDATGKTVHFLWDWFTHDCSFDAGTTFRGPALLSPHFSWKGTGPRLPRWVITPDRQMHIVQQGSWSYYNSTGYGDQDIFYRRYDLDTPMETEENQALHIIYTEPDYGESGQEGYGNMQIPPHTDLSFSRGFTAEFWFKLDGDAPLKNMRLLVKENLTSQYYAPTGYQIGLNMSDALRPNGGINTSTGQYMVWSEHVMVPEVWTHFALTYDSTHAGNNLLLYVNGELSVYTAATGRVLGGEGILFVGAVRNFEATMGSFDEIRLWNRVLPAQEIKDNMAFPLTGSENGLVAYFPLNGTTRDMTGNGHDGVLMYKESFFVTDWHSIPPGDANGDGDVDLLDMITAANHILGISVLEGQFLWAADCNGDGDVDLLDLISIANVILGIGECTPGQCRTELTPEVLKLLKSLEAHLSPEHFQRLMALVREQYGPTRYALSQNYPNPFNPETEIAFSLAEKCKVDVTVYNILGQVIETLVDTELEAGHHAIRWNGESVASGVYFYRMTAGDFTETRRMLLLK